MERSFFYKLNFKRFDFTTVFMLSRVGLLLRWSESEVSVIVIGVLRSC